MVDVDNFSSLDEQSSTVSQCDDLETATVKLTDEGDLADGAASLTLETLPSKSVLQISNGLDDDENKPKSDYKLPSYLGISCAINGYASYSRFCRSRDNSPARAMLSSFSPFGALEGRPGANGATVHRVQNFNSDPVATMNIVLSMPADRQVPASKTFLGTRAESVSSDGSQYGGETVSEPAASRLVANGHPSLRASVLPSDESTEKKSLVQLRIESLYGRAAAPTLRVSRNRTRPSRPADNVNMSNGSSDKFATWRSPSFPPDSCRGRSQSPPVFRHLTKDFREQLRAADIGHIYAGKKNGHGEDGKLPNIRTSKTANSYHITTGTLGSESEKKVLPRPVRTDSSERSLRELSENNNRHYINEPVIMNGCKELPDKSPSGSVEILSKSPLDIAVTLPLVSPVTDEKDGHWFMDMMGKEREQIAQLVTLAEQDLANRDVPEEVGGVLRAGIGKANLLLSKKFEQFKGLCYKNLEQDATDPFCTSASDLAGFWDMVMIQVQSVKDTFAEIDQLRQNNWKSDGTVKVAQTKSKMVVKKPISRSTPTSPQRSAKALEQAQARDEARKRLLEAKQRGRLRNTGASESDLGVSIFCSENKN